MFHGRSLVLTFIEECANQKAKGYGGHDKTHEKDNDEGWVAVFKDNYRCNLQYNCEASLVTLEVVSQENKEVKLNSLKTFPYPQVKWQNLTK